MTDLEHAKSIIDNTYIRNYFDNLYPFTTENIKGYLKLLDIKNKDVLTVGASGDQTLNLILNKANNIDCFDINELCKYYLDLKIGAIKALNYDDFFKYFCYKCYPNMFNENRSTFNIKLYQKIHDYLSYEDKIFWDGLYQNYLPSHIRKSELFKSDEVVFNVLLKINEYLEEEKYYQLKNKLLKNEYNINFINSDIRNINFTKKYDIILLSNIAQYIECMFDDNYLENFKKIIDKMICNLNDNGMILVSYLYGIDDNEDVKYIPIIYDLDRVYSVFNNLETIRIKSMYNLQYPDDSEINDGVLIYKKTK